MGVSGIFEFWGCVIHLCVFRFLFFGGWFSGLFVSLGFWLFWFAGLIGFVCFSGLIVFLGLLVLFRFAWELGFMYLLEELVQYGVFVFPGFLLLCDRLDVFGLWLVADCGFCSFLFLGFRGFWLRVFDLNWFLEFSFYVIFWFVVTISLIW